MLLHSTYLHHVEFLLCCCCCCFESHTQTRRDPVLMAFLKSFLSGVVEPLKIDDIQEVKNHATTLYNTKKLAKDAAKTTAKVATTKSTISSHLRLSSPLLPPISHHSCVYLCARTRGAFSLTTSASCLTGFVLSLDSNGLPHSLL
jgi:hypothetical protein